MASNYYELVKVGNRKVGDACAVWNMGAAHDCPARALGVCQLQICPFAKENDCYAYRDERRMPGVLAFRRRQGRAWLKGPEAFIHTLAAIQATRPWVNECRYNEAGDLGSQDEVGVLFELARAVPDMIHFGYTARQDLRWAERPKNLRVNGSGWARGNMNEYRVVQKPSGSNPVCPGNCRTCDLCKIERGIVIESVLRRPGRQEAR